MEMKNKEEYFEGIKRNLKLEKGRYVESNGLSGGLALWWRKDANVTIHRKDEYMMDTIVNMNKGDGDVYLTWIYGSTNWRDRLGLWKRMRTTVRTRNGSWMCVRDFNEIAKVSEKVGGRLKQPRKMETFNTMMHDTRLVDMGYNGQHITWSNNREGDHEIREGIDRSTANTTWIRRYPSSVVIHKLNIGFDHCPLVVQLEPTERRGQ